MPTRVVMVEFNPGVTPQEVEEFRGWLDDLAARTPNLVRMTCGEHRPITAEAELSANAPSVVFGSFVSIWEFRDDQALEDFVLEPFHREMAGRNFRRLVMRRYVINIL